MGIVFVKTLLFMFKAGIVSRFYLFRKREGWREGGREGGRDQRETGRNQLKLGIEFSVLYYNCYQYRLDSALLINNSLFRCCFCC